MKDRFRMDWFRFCLTVTAVALPFTGQAGDGAPGSSSSAPKLTAPFQRTAEYDYEAPAPGTYSLPPLKDAPDGIVLATSGKAYRLRSLMKGRITLLSFIYTRCADPRACPRATSVLARLHDLTREDEALAENLRLLSLSFDPGHDTPEVMAEYASHVRGGPGGAGWCFLTTRSDEELAPILAGYGQRVDRKRQANDPLGPLHHTLRVVLVDGEGRIRNIYSYGLFDPRLVMADIRTLLMTEMGADGN